MSAGFTVITGETGAGKSLLLESFGLLTGNRAFQDKPGDPESKSVVEGIFHLNKEEFIDFFVENDLDFHENTMIRREIIPGGRSRAFINDTPVNVSVLKALGENLVDIHSQHDVQKIVQPEHQLYLLDIFSGLKLEVRKHESAYHDLKKKETELQRLLDEQHKSQSDLDYWQYQLNELNAAQLDGIDYELLKSAVHRADNMELIQSEVGSLLNNLQKEDDGIQDLLRKGQEVLSRLGTIAPEFQSLADRLGSVNIELEDIAQELNYLLQDEESSSGEAERNRESLDELNRLMYKHSAQSFEELKEIKISLENKLSGIEKGSDRIEHLKSQIINAQIDIHKLSEHLRKARLMGAAELQKRLLGDFRFLHLENAVIELNLTTKDLGATGMDFLDIRFSANPGRKTESLSKVASGGERSRLMLALKKAFSEKGSIPTTVLDEIDTGISGETALRVGEFLQKMASKVQIVAVTHLAQVAGRADHHFHIHKTTENGETTSYLIPLVEDEKTIEIARLISGDRITTSAREQALWLQGKVG